MLVVAAPRTTVVARIVSAASAVLATRVVVVRMVVARSIVVLVVVVAVVVIVVVAVLVATVVAARMAVVLIVLVVSVVVAARVGTRGTIWIVVLVARLVVRVLRLIAWLKVESVHLLLVRLVARTICVALDWTQTRRQLPAHFRVRVAHVVDVQCLEVSESILQTIAEYQRSVIDSFQFLAAGQQVSVSAIVELVAELVVRQRVLLASRVRLVLVASLWLGVLQDDRHWRPLASLEWLVEFQYNLVVVSAIRLRVASSQEQLCRLGSSVAQSPGFDLFLLGLSLRAVVAVR